MPAILSPEHYDLWLDAGFRRTAALKELLSPFDAKLMKRFHVTTRVNFVKNDDPDDPQCAVALQAMNAGDAN
jgi:putative SOS response-associated peptidase YedK